MGCVSSSQRSFPLGPHQRDEAGLPLGRNGVHWSRLRARGWETPLGLPEPSSRYRTRKLSSWVSQDLSRPMVSKPSGKRFLRVPRSLACPSSAAVFPGLAILSGIFDALGLKRMETSKCAARGLLWDLAGEGAPMPGEHGANLRERFHIVKPRPSACSAGLSVRGPKAWNLKGASAADLLRWAGALHELGMDVARVSHKHGAYLLTHMVGGVL